MMAGLLATIVEWRDLGESVLAALVAGLAVTLIFSIAVLGASRFLDLRAASRPGAAAFAAVTMVIALIAFAALIVVGLYVMTQ